MGFWIAVWLFTTVLFIAIDMVWLMGIARSTYVAEIGGLLRDKPDLAAAGAFYALYATGLIIMVIAPAIRSQSVSQALIYGALLGLVAYGTYDLTNLSVAKGFTARIALIDMAWGTVLTGIVSTATVWLAGYFRG